MKAHFLLMFLLIKLLIFASIGICVNHLFEKANTVESEKQPLKIYKVKPQTTTKFYYKVVYFIFNDILYKQIDGVAMGSLLGSSLANAFLCYITKKTG